MPSGVVPTYGYVPAAFSGDVRLRSCSSLRARLFEGGTYFRVREPGMPGNRISVQVIEYGAPDGPNPDAVCVVTNYTIKTDEMVTGPVKAVISYNNLRADQKLVIDQLHTTTPRARQYGISFKIAPPPDTVTELGRFAFSRPFVVPGSLVAKLTSETAVFTPSDEIVIEPRYRVYRLATTTVIDTGTMLPTTGWDIANLRAQVNANDPWIEMLERSATDGGPGGPPIPSPNPIDAQDDGIDADFLTPFAETFMKGGDGLPDNPDREHTGPTRSLVHVNYGERYNGTLGEVNVVYEWVGESATEGGWVAY